MKRLFVKYSPLLALCIMVSPMADAQSLPKEPNIKLITLDPGHFHAALVQKNSYSTVSPIVHVYAPQTPDVTLHLERINTYNKRENQPTNWQEKLYTGKDYFEKMLQEKVGNVVVIAGNNQLKSTYIDKSIKANFNVLSDKPMIINEKDFPILKNSFQEATQNNVLLYDIMTERYEISTILQREFSKFPTVFGKLEKGTFEHPAIVKESVHHFYKYVSGTVLTRPAWFMDVSQQGEGLVDVSTHLVDLVQWACFPEQVIDYQKDINILQATRWATDMSLNQFKAITKTQYFPSYLKKDIVQDTLLKVFSNGEINYQLKGIHAKTSVTWAYKAPEGGGDTHYSIMRGSKANLVIRQGAAQHYQPTLYIEPVATIENYETELNQALQQLQQQYEGITLAKTTQGWQVNIPAKYIDGHEAHFAKVTEKYLSYLAQGKLPNWEIPNMIAKYYTTTQALKKALTITKPTN
jgi:predicted dehydrogenase